MRDSGPTPGASHAHSVVLWAVSTGALPAIDSNTKCADCGKPAVCYDHRDYNKPLEVEAVCGACNVTRGRAIAVEGSEYMERIALYFAEPDLDALRVLAKQTDVSTSELIRRAVREYVRRNRLKHTAKRGLN